MFTLNRICVIIPVGGGTYVERKEKKDSDYMKAEIRKKGYPPTVREICADLGIRSTSTVHKDIDSLEKQVT